jgi:branched-chain amino acid transport system substrate-binding protein
MRRTLAVLAGLGALVMAFTGASALATGDESKAKAPIVVGMPIAMTGFINFYDSTVLKGAQVAAAEINRQGGLLGGRKLTIVTSDTKSDIAQSANAAIDVAEKGATLIIPTVDYDFGGPAARVGQQRKIVVIGAAGDARWGLKGLGNYVFNDFPAGALPAASAATFAAQVKKWKNAFILNDTSLNFTKLFVQDFKSSYQKQGGKIGGEATFANNDPSIATQIAKIRQTRPDFIVLSSYAPGGVTALKQIRGAGLTQPVLAPGSFDGTFFLAGLSAKEVKDFYAVGSGVTANGGDPNKARSAFFKAYYDANGRKPAPLASQALQGYVAVKSYALAVQRAKSTNGAKVKAQMEKFRNELVGPWKLTWTPKCHIPSFPLVIKTFKNGKDVFVAEPTPRAVSSKPC